MGRPCVADTHLSVSGMVFGLGFLQVSKKNFLFAPVFSALHHRLHSFWATEGGSSFWKEFFPVDNVLIHLQGVLMASDFVSCPSVLPIVCTPQQRLAARLEQL